jgi:hypothetical protein
LHLIPLTSGPQANVPKEPSLCFKMIVFGTYIICGQFEGAGHFYDKIDGKIMQFLNLFSA